MKINNKLKQILWVEGNGMIHRDFQEEALSYGLQLIPYDCWDDAYNALHNDFSRWAAIIMQPKSKLHAGSMRRVMQFLPQAFSDINVLCAIKGRILPWYLLTDINEKDFLDLVLESRNAWDSGWPNKYYDSSIPEERLILFKRIKDQTQLNEKQMVKTGQYRNVFEALNYLYGHQLNSNIGEIIEDMLVSTCFGNANRYDIGTVREVIEYMFYSMVKNNLLPETLKNATGRINIGYCSKLLSGLDVVNNNVHYHVIVPIINKIMANNIYNMLKLGNSGKHAANESDSKELNNYLRTIGTNNLLNSCALQLCDIILWYEQTIKKAQEQIDHQGKVLQWWSETKCDNN